MRGTALALGIGLVVAACSSPEVISLGQKRQAPGVGAPGGMDASTDAAAIEDSGRAARDSGGVIDGGLAEGDPKTCAQAVLTQGYLGCEFWPTPIANATFDIFDFAVVVINPGEAPAVVEVTGPLGPDQSLVLQPGALTKVYLKWVPELKGNTIELLGIYSAPQAVAHSVLKTKGAYRLSASSPVLVYQFSPLQWKGEGGPSGKDWAACPIDPKKPGCFSHSNDASLLLPTTALTGNYRVATVHADDSNVFPLWGHHGVQSSFAITATKDDTLVTIKLSDTGAVLSGDGIATGTAGSILTLRMDAGDVAQLISPNQSGIDLTGSQVQADKPVQVIGSSPCVFNPLNVAGCDHVEEIVLPAETLGKTYAVTMPTAPNGSRAIATVRFIGNVDGTQLTYFPALPAGPTTLNAGQVVELDQVTHDFLVTGSHEFLVATVQRGLGDVDQAMERGDPSLSVITAIEQYRTTYVFPRSQRLGAELRGGGGRCRCVVIARLPAGHGEPVG